jgi:hypothetical protein
MDMYVLQIPRHTQYLYITEGLKYGIFFKINIHFAILPVINLFWVRINALQLKLYGYMLDFWLSQQ